MASDRGGSVSLNRGQNSAPGIAALFLIHFDIKTGYTVEWHRNLPHVTLQDTVEFKSLPSGSHNVNEDLVYFIQDDHAGLSAFINKPAGESERNALMLAVGVLVPLSHGRLGKAWRHAASLKELAQMLADDYKNTEPLEQYWDLFQLPKCDNESPPESPIASIPNLKPNRAQYPDDPQRSRTLSDAAALLTSKQVLAPFHPALSLPDFKNSFGPLMFPLYRAALLRKRILFLGDSPVETSCDFGKLSCLPEPKVITANDLEVYDLALLSSLPQTIIPFLPSTGHPPLWPRSLFNVGVHDLPYLSTLTRDSTDKGDGCFIACTSDRVLGVKPELYDVLVDLPPSYSKDAPEKMYPKLSLTPSLSLPSKPSKTLQVKATQRDVRRFWALREGLKDLARTHAATEQDEESDAASTFSSNSLVEPLSWPVLAYTSFIWWASAGEKGLGQSEEEKEQDLRLLLPDDDSIYSPCGRRGSISYPERDTRTQEIAMITYFRRLTTQIFAVLFDIVSRQDEEEGELTNDASLNPLAESDDGEYEDELEHPAPATNDGDIQPLLNPDTSPAIRTGVDYDENKPIVATTADMVQMGLDPWSESDRMFVEELIHVWWGRQGQVQGARIQCCGVRIL
ncbi:hypothetical protein LOZ65_003107 [Ophidiomyces ophidiicola]|nr:hypothetical protein LOZ65_003107 [Ophidiomyces ophidiicola]